MKQIEWMKLIKKAGLCLLIVMALLFVFSCVLAWMALEEMVTPQNTRSIINIMRIVMLFIMCFYVSKQSRHGKLLISTCSACAFVLALMFCKALLFPSETLYTGAGLWLSILIAVPAGIAASQKKARKR